MSVLSERLRNGVRFRDVLPCTRSDLKPNSELLAPPSAGGSVAKGVWCGMPFTYSFQPDPSSFVLLRERKDVSLVAWSSFVRTSARMHRTGRNSVQLRPPDRDYRQQRSGCDDRAGGSMPAWARGEALVEVAAGVNAGTRH